MRPARPSMPPLALLQPLLQAALWSALLLLLLSQCAVPCASVPQVDPVISPGAPFALGVVLPLDVYPCYALAALHAARDINEGTILSLPLDQQRWLPNHTVQLHVSESRQSSSVALAATLGQMETHGVVGVIGEVTSGVTAPLATLLSAFRTPHVAPQASVGDLSNKDLFPFFARTVGGDDQQALALHSIMRHFGWTQAQIVYATDTYGTAFAADLQAVSNSAPARNESGVTFTSVNSFQTGDVASIGAALDAIVADGAPIVALLASHSSDARQLARLVVSRGLLGRFQFLACDGWFHAAVIKNSPPHLKANFTAFLEGVVGTVPLIPRSEAAGRLARRIRADTLGPLSFNYDARTCVETDTTTSYYYDAVLMLVRCASLALARKEAAGVERGKANITGSALMREMLGGLELEGVTGHLELNANGDRLASYSLTNYRKADGDVLVSAGTFVHRGGGSRAQTGAAAAASWGAWHIDIHRTPIFVSGSSTPPSSARPRRVAAVISARAAHGFIAGSVVLGVLVSLLPLAFVVHYRRHVAIKSSNVFLTVLLLIGALIGCVYPSVAAMHLALGAVDEDSVALGDGRSGGGPILAGITDDASVRSLAQERHGAAASCLLGPLLLSLGYSVLFGSLLTKLSLIRLIFGNHALKLYRFGVAASVAPTAAFLLVDAAIFLAWGMQDPPRLERRPLATGLASPDAAGASGSRTHERGVDYFACVQDRTLLWQLLLLLPKFFTLALTALVAFRVREVPHAFNESRFIGIILYNLLFVSALAILLVNALDSPLVDLLVQALSVWYCLAATVVLLILPKALVILGTIRRANSVVPMQMQQQQQNEQQKHGNNAQHQCADHKSSASPRVRMSPPPLGSLGQGRARASGGGSGGIPSSLRGVRPSTLQQSFLPPLSNGPSFDVQLESPALSEYVARSSYGTEGPSVAGSAMPPFNHCAVEAGGWTAGLMTTGPTPFVTPVRPSARQQLLEDAAIQQSSPVSALLQLQATTTAAAVVDPALPCHLTEATVSVSPHATKLPPLRAPSPSTPTAAQQTEQLADAQSSQPTAAAELVAPPPDTVGHPSEPESHSAR